VAHIEFWRERNGALRLSRQLVERMRTKLIDCHAQRIYVTHDLEAHPEHRLAARLVKRAVAALPEGEQRPVILMYEVWTPLQAMDHIVDISPYIEVKLAAVRAHRSQCRVLSFDEAIWA